MDTLGELRSADANVSPASRRPNRSPASLARRAQADAARVDRRTPEERARRAAQERARVARQRAEREAQEVGRKEVAVEQLLERVHASSGSTVTANSRRLRSLRGDDEARHRRRRVERRARGGRAEQHTQHAPPREAGGRRGEACSQEGRTKAGVRGREAAAAARRAGRGQCAATWQVPSAAPHPLPKLRC